MVYSPPTNFTSNGHVYCTDGLGSSNLKPGHEPAFAGYIGDVLSHFATNPVLSERVAFDYVMPVNEPAYEWNSKAQEGCRHSNSDIVAIAQSLRSALDVRGLDTGILLTEAGTLTSLHQVESRISGKYGETYGNYLSAFAGITNLISRNLTAHSYWTDNPDSQLVPVRQALKAQLDANPHWRYWQSEYCVLGADGPGRDLGMTTALNVARVIWADLAVANASAWHWWLALSQADYKDGLLYTDYWQPGDAETLYCSKNFWAFGQWSRFIRPGWRRVDLPGFNNVHGLLAAAFVDPSTNRLAMVFVNHSGTNQWVSPSVDNLPANKAIVGWERWITSDAPSDNLSPLPPLAPGATCHVPSNSVMTLMAGLVEPAGIPLPVIDPVASRTVTTGEVATVVATLTAGSGPGRLLDLSVWSDDPAILPQSAIGIGDEWPMGTLTHEVFANFSGSGLGFLSAAPAFPNAPGSTGTIGLFEVPPVSDGPRGNRVRGFLVPPQSGDYTFWISSRDGAELYLSSSEDPACKTRIAWVPHATGLRDWAVEPSQQSMPVRLEDGRSYYVEAVQTGAGGGGHLSVGWQLPDATLERPVPAQRLSPWVDPLTNSVRRRLSFDIPVNAAGTTTVFMVATDTFGRMVTNQFALNVVSTLETNPPVLSVAIQGANVILTWPASHTGWLLEVQANAPTAGLSGEWHAVGESAVTNRWISALLPEGGFYRLRLP